MDKENIKDFLERIQQEIEELREAEEADQESEPKGSLIAIDADDLIPVSFIRHQLEINEKAAEVAAILYGDEKIKMAKYATQTVDLVIDHWKATERKEKWLKKL